MRKHSVVGALGALLGAGGFLVAAADGQVVLEKFVDPLPIPHVAQPVTGQVGGAATYEIAVMQVQQKLHRELPPTTVWGYDGVFPGPTIVAKVNEPVTVQWMNELRDGSGEYLMHHHVPVDTCLHGPNHHGAHPVTTTHLHGAHVDWLSDGYPEHLMMPGQSQTFHYPNKQEAATLWYHDHAMGITRLNVLMGLAGFYLLVDDVELSLNLPSGEHEIAMAIQDRTFAADGSFVYPAEWQDHFFGDTILVNGMVWPYLEVERGKYRFRWLNGSGSRTYTLSLSDGAGFHVIGTEGGLLPAPVAVDSVTIMPGERIDVVVDFGAYAPGTEIVLTNSAPAPFPGSPGMGVVPDVMKFIVQDAVGDTDPLPSELRPLEVIDPAESILERPFVLSREPLSAPPCAGPWWLINGLGWSDITEYPRLGTTETWAWINPTGMSHPMHMHLVMFQVLDRQPFQMIGGQIMPTGPRVPPLPHEAGWKDTVAVGPREIVRVIARFEDYAGKFAYHCHILEHEDHEMMRQFQTLHACPCEYDGLTEAVNVFDLLAYLDLWFGGDGAANVDGVTGVDVFDLLAFLDCWFPASAGADCP